jgi:hypothetical protein
VAATIIGTLQAGRRSYRNLISQLNSIDAANRPAFRGPDRPKWRTKAAISAKQRGELAAN